MSTLKRLLQVSALSLCVLSSTAVLALADSAGPGADVQAASDSTAKVELPAPEGIDFGDLFAPEPIHLTCTATSQCTQVGGIPVSCGGSTCTSYALWVTCDGHLTPCTCNPSGISNCIDPVAFCECWSANPSQNYIVCRRAHCV
jgi:hypothetical protein